MSLLLELPKELEAELTAQAESKGITLSTYALQLLAAGVREEPAFRTGADLVAYWQSEGLVGTRSDIPESSLHARVIRDQAHKRIRP
ncbi:hypothetical protein BH10PLA2_BH10PLA2_23430 [soil metagenome]